jgi:tetratricopeptide (TPR) repeat protein
MNPRGLWCFGPCLLCLAWLAAAPLRAERIDASGPSSPGATPHSPEAKPAAKQAVLAADAVETWQRRTRERPEDVAAWVKLGDAWMQRSRDRAGEPCYTQAEAAYRRAHELVPKHAGALVGRAWVCNSRHLFDEGRRWARAALAVEPKLPEAFALLGDAAVEAGDYDEAFEHYQTCLDLRPDLSAYARAAHLLWLTGDARRARALMRQAVTAGSPHADNVAWCRAELALMMFHTGALLPADKELERALVETPQNPHVLAAMGRIKMARKEYARAIEFYEQAQSILPQHATLAALTDLYALTGETEKAEALFTRVRAFHAAHGAGHAHDHATGPDASHVHGNVELARFLADQNRDVAEGLREAEAARTESRSVPVLDTLAWCYYRNGRIGEARKAIQKALRWRTPDAAILFHAGMIYAAAGDRLAAQKHLYQALNLNPHFHPVQAEIASQTLAQLSAQLTAQRKTATPAPTSEADAADGRE